MSANDLMGNVRKNWRQRANEKTTLRDELRIVPRWLRTFVVVLYLAGLAVAELMNFVAARGLIPGGMFAPDLGPVVSNLALAGLVTLGAAVAAAVILLFGYIYADAKRRGMSPGLWLIIAMFVPYLIGVILYFVLREPLPFHCPRCEAPVTAQFNFCPRCQLNLRPNCPQCRREVKSGDRFCPFCGATLDPGAATRPVTSAEAVRTV